MFLAFWVCVLSHFVIVICSLQALFQCFVISLVCLRFFTAPSLVCFVRLALLKSSHNQIFSCFQNKCHFPKTAYGVSEILATNPSATTLSTYNTHHTTTSYNPQSTMKVKKYKQKDSNIYSLKQIIKEGKEQQYAWRKPSLIRCFINKSSPLGQQQE